MRSFLKLERHINDMAILSDPTNPRPVDEKLRRIRVIAIEALTTIDKLRKNLKKLSRTNED